VSGVIAAIGLLATLVAIAAIPRVRDRDSRVYHFLAGSWRRFTGKPREWPSIALPYHELFTGGRLGPRWRWTGETSVRHEVEGTSLVVVALRESVWWMNRRGSFVYLPVSGDVDFVASVKVRRATDPDASPDCEWQFAGLMLRDPRGDGALTLENYVFVVIGHRGHSLQAEFKSTTGGRSDVSAVDWPRGDAVLRVVRQGARFSVSIKPPGPADWRLLHVYERPDLPVALQAGLLIYSFSEGRGAVDLRATFADIVVDTPKTES
jgi:hypothetical protein